MEAAMSIILVVILIYLVAFACAIATYVMNAISFYTIAARRQIKNPWLAWIPFANNWLIGSIVDEYEMRNGRKSNWRLVLLLLSVIPIAFIIVMYIALFALMFSTAFQFANTTPDAAAVTSLLGIILPIYILLIVAIVVMMAAQFLLVICVYKVFESTVPNKAMKYILLYLLVPFAGSICLLKCRNQGYANSVMTYGMPTQPNE